MSDSDNDYCDVGAADTIAANESDPVTNDAPNEKNGKDIAWIEFKCLKPLMNLMPVSFSLSLRRISQRNLPVSLIMLMLKSMYASLPGDVGLYRAS